MVAVNNDCSVISCWAPRVIDACTSENSLAKLVSSAFHVSRTVSHRPKSAAAGGASG